MSNHCEELEQTLRKQTQSRDTEIEELKDKIQQIEIEKDTMRKEHADEVCTLPYLSKYCKL